MECEIEDKTYYPGLAEQVREELSQKDKNRFVPMEERRDTSVLSVEVLRNLCHGKTCIIVSPNLEHSYINYGPMLYKGK